MTIFEMMGFDTWSFIAGAVYATIFGAVSWFTIIGIAAWSSRSSRRYKKLRRKYMK